MGKRKCPKCGERKGVRLVYGEVSDNAAIAQAESGEVVLGGCAVAGTDPDWHCLACSHEWRARRSMKKMLSNTILSTEMMEGLRRYGVPAMRRMNEAEEFAGRLAPMGVFRGWAEHFGLPQAAVDPAFELTRFWVGNPGAASRLEIPRAIRAHFEALNAHREE